MLPNLLHQAHEYIRCVLPAGGVAIDATVGNGNDTLFLAKIVGKSGTVYGFDIQDQALRATRKRLESEGHMKQVQLFQYPHQQPWSEILPNQLRQNIDAVMFNLGYLPHGDPSIITKPQSTIAACEQALEWLRSGGLITLVLYTGHKGGTEEAESVLKWCRSLPHPQFSIMLHQRLNRTHAPSLVVIEKNFDRKMLCQ